MSTTVTLAGVSYSIPAEGDGNYASDLSAYFIALANNTKVFQVSSSNFPLQQETSFGATYGLKVAYVKSQATNPAGTGIVRLGNNESVSWRNAGNSSDLSLKVNASDALEFNGSRLLGAGLGSIVNADISSSAAIAYSKLNLTGSIVNADISASAAIAYSKLSITAGEIPYSKLALTGSVVNADVSASAAIAYSKLSLTGSILNADINASAAISYSKLSLSNSIVNADINSSAAIAYSKLSLSNSIVNADLSSSAAIALSKLATVTASKALVSDSSGYVSASSVTSTELNLLSGKTGVLVTEAGTQTLTNKTLTTPTVDIILGTDQGITPSPPSAGSRKLYSKSDGKWYSLDSSNVETQLGSGGSGGINYLTDADADSSVTLWSTYADAAGTSPVDGTGGSPNSTFTRTTSSPLRGGGSFLFTKGAANRQGEGFSTSFTIADADKGKVLACSFNYAIASGTYADDDLQFWVYDMINGTLIQPTPYKLKKHNLISDKMFFEFQTNTTSALYRIICHVASTSTSAYTVKFDDWLCGPQAKLYGSVATDAVAYTGSFSYAGTTATNITSQTYRQSRVADRLTVSGNVAFNGAANAIGQFRIPLPSGLAIDTSKITSAYQIVGFAVGYFNSAKQFNGHIRIDGNSTSYVTIHKWDDSGAVDQDWGGHTTAGSNVPAGVAMASGDGLSFTFTVPISGWSSSQVLSSDADTRVVACNVYRNSAWTATGAGGTVAYDTVAIDTHGGFNTGTSKYTVLVPGYYRIKAAVSLNSGGVVNRMTVDLYKNASIIASKAGTTNVQGVSAEDVDTIVSAVAGDTFNANYTQDTGASRTGSTGAVQTYMTIERLTGPSQIAASESINASYSSTSGQSITAASFQTVTWNVKNWDSHNAYSGGTYTIPAAGKYQINAGVSIQVSNGFDADGILSIFKNGAEVIRGPRITLKAAAIGPSGVIAPSVSNIISCNAGDLITIQVYQANNATRSMDATAAFNTFSIAKVGN